jgi:hypothetical protein
VRARNALGWGAWSAQVLFNRESGVSLLSNGGFESGISPWIRCSTRGTTARIADAIEGSKALRLTGSDCRYQEFALSPNQRYRFSCQAKGALTQYTSVGFQIADQGYAALVNQEREVSSSTYQAYTASLLAPAGAALGVVTLYSEDTGKFDDCSVVVE